MRIPKSLKSSGFIIHLSFCTGWMDALVRNATAVVSSACSVPWRHLSSSVSHHFCISHVMAPFSPHSNHPLMGLLTCFPKGRTMILCICPGPEIYHMLKNIDWLQREREKKKLPQSSSQSRRAHL